MKRKLASIWFTCLRLILMREFLVPKKTFMLRQGTRTHILQVVDYGLNSYLVKEYNSYVVIFSGKIVLRYISRHYLETQFRKLTKYELFCAYHLMDGDGLTELMVDTLEV